MSKYQDSWNRIKTKIAGADPQDIEAVEYLVNDTDIRDCIKKREWNYTKRKYETLNVCPRCFYEVKGTYNFCPHCGLAVRVNG